MFGAITRLIAFFTLYNSATRNKRRKTVRSKYLKEEIYVQPSGSN